MRNRRLAVRLEGDLAAVLDAIARDSGKNASELLRGALRQLVDSYQRRQSCYDLALSLGLLSRRAKAPGDLSVNKRHFAGFGR